MTLPARLIATMIVAVPLIGCQPARGLPAGGAAAAAPPASDENIARVPLGNPPGEVQIAAATIRNPFEGDAAAIAQGKALFSAMNCVYCHGANASGLMGPPLDGPGWRYGGAPAQLYNSIHDGRPKGMPAWGARLPPQEIWRLVAYLESLGGASAPATDAMPAMAGPAQSTTGPEPAGQEKADAARQALSAADAAARR